MLTAVLCLCQVHDPIYWTGRRHAFELASKEQKLVMVPDHEYNEKVSPMTDAFFRDAAVVSAASNFACVKGGSVLSLLDMGPYYTPGRCVRFFDRDEKPCGLALAPMDPGLFADLTTAIVSTWKKHDSLVFRSKVRLNDSDWAKLSFSYAMRGNTDQASAALASMSTVHGIEEAEFACMGLALAFAEKRDLNRTIDNWSKLERLTKSPKLKSLARTGCGAAMMPDRPKEAWSKLRKVVDTQDSSPIDKWWAEYFLAKLKAGGIDGG